jgi:uncharacterized damage-inducible protein DinB
MYDEVRETWDDRLCGRMNGWGVDINRRLGLKGMMAIPWRIPASPILPMTNKAYFSHLAAYNQWMNRKLYEAAAGLPEEELQRDRGAFFGSIFGTLSHIAVGDTIWFKRIANHLPGCASLKPLDDLPMPSSLDHRPRETLADLSVLRTSLDETIIAFCAEVQASQLAGPFEFKTTKGIPIRKLLGDVLLHVFNHQTHHRGQVTTLFSQLGIDAGPTDLILLLPDAP